MTDKEDIERRLDFLVRELDELCALAKNPETAKFLHSQKIVIGQIYARASLILLSYCSQSLLRDA